MVWMSPPGPLALCGAELWLQFRVLPPANQTGSCSEGDNDGKFGRKWNNAEEERFLPALAECQWLLSSAAWELFCCMWNSLEQSQSDKRQYRVTKQKTPGGNNTQRSDFTFLLRHTVGSYQNPVRKRRARFLVVQIILKVSLCHTLKPKVHEWAFPDSLFVSLFSGKLLSTDSS